MKEYRLPHVMVVEDLELVDIIGASWNFAFPVNPPDWLCHLLDKILPAQDLFLLAF